MPFEVPDGGRYLHFAGGDGVTTARAPMLVEDLCVGCKRDNGASEVEGLKKVLIHD